jgi:hypothetical protein
MTDYVMIPRETIREVEALLAASSHYSTSGRVRGILRAALEAKPVEPVAQVISSGCYEFPLLRWISANHSLETPIGSLLYPAPPVPADKAARIAEDYHD